VTAEITLGPVALCGSCCRARSTLGKGAFPAPLPAGPVIDVLDRVTDADAAVRQARRHLDAAVTRARSRGSSWTQIAGRLGITRQAAQQRFGHNPSPPGAAGAPPFTARQERTPS
jgi:hypothetical protein